MLTLFTSAGSSAKDHARYFAPYSPFFEYRINHTPAAFAVALSESKSREERLTFAGGAAEVLVQRGRSIKDFMPGRAEVDQYIEEKLVVWKERF